VLLVDAGGEEEEEEETAEEEEGEEEGSGDGWGKVATNCYKSCNKQQQQKQFVISFRNGASVGAFLQLLPSHMLSPAHLWLRIHLPFARIACPLMDPILITLPPNGP